MKLKIKFILVILISNTYCLNLIKRYMHFALLGAIHTCCYYGKHNLSMCNILSHLCMQNAELYIMTILVLTLYLIFLSVSHFNDFLNLIIPHTIIVR